MRQHCQLITSSYNEVDEDDPLFEVNQYELSTRLTNVQAELDEIEQSLSYYNATITEETENDLMSTVTSQRQMKSELDEIIADILNQINNKETELANIKSSNYMTKVEQNNVKITNLSELLKEMKDEEKEMLSKHEEMCHLEPSNIEATKEINVYMRKLQMLQHSHARKIVDFRKLQKDLEREKGCVITLKQEKELTERKRRERIAFHQSFKARAQALEENAKKMQEQMYFDQISSQSQTESEMNSRSTTATESRRRHRHKRKHWHHHSDKTENVPQNIEKVEKEEEEPLIEFDDTPIDVVERIRKEPVITFKTEVEKTESLHIGNTV
ncbi:hypothetical protein TRFO_29277 [Tritrichomonas foetus]|uniref:Uncharacterized protein n=1 Tax=Tritrichomonas foetus TaxID=1144522 RepID=A0A1J4K0T8_9EUKA|nr:hypothetical protein TRFO_29277 [Tritrichomonas foetus]|eukprot:OHT03356.1 hypothetical protein TRFO_29277 [Tritrichomonas foetus]